MGRSCIGPWLGDLDPLCRASSCSQSSGKGSLRPCASPPIASCVILAPLSSLHCLPITPPFPPAPRRATSSGKLIPGPERPFPLVGGIVEMVMNPFAFWEKQRVYSDPGMSYNSLVGKFILFITDAEKCREVMSVRGAEREI